MSITAIRAGGAPCCRAERVERQVDEQRRDDDTARRAPHVARRDVPPPAVVEAEEDEDGELDPEDDRERLPREEVLVERRNRLVEADPERQPPRGGDQDRIWRRGSGSDA
jgi:hypothetical protein